MTKTLEPRRIFRAGLPADAQAIRLLLLQSNLAPPAVVDLERATHSLIGEIRTFVCEQERNVVGVIQWRNLGEEAEILDLAVDPVRRRRGHASFLLQNFLHHASQLAVQKIFLEVRESNAAAIALYKKLGFQLSGCRPNYYHAPEEHALLMSFSFPA